MMKIFCALAFTFFLVGCGTQTTSNNILPEMKENRYMPIPDSTELTTSQGNTVILDYFMPDQPITSPLVLSGTVPAGWQFEGSFPIELRTEEGEVLKEWYGEAVWIDEQGNFIEGSNKFISIIEFEIPESVTSPYGILWLSKDLVVDSDNPAYKEDFVEISVQWGGMGEEGQDPVGSIPDGLSHVEAGMVDHASCAAGGGDIEEKETGESVCTTFDGRSFEE